MQKTFKSLFWAHSTRYEYSLGANSTLFVENGAPSGQRLKIKTSSSPQLCAASNSNHIEKVVSGRTATKLYNKRLAETSHRQRRKKNKKQTRLINNGNSCAKPNLIRSLLTERTKRKSVFSVVQKLHLLWDRKVQEEELVRTPTWIRTGVWLHLDQLFWSNYPPTWASLGSAKH